MAKPWTKPQGSTTGGYPNHKVLLANNTFLMVDLGADINGMVTYSTARPESVAVIDVTDSGCGGSAAANTDTDETLRGVGSPVLMNNLFRTPPFVGPISAAFAMLGIERDDTLVNIPGLGVLPSNAFAPSRVSTASNNYSNGYFQSMQAATRVVNQGTHPPIQLVDCHVPPGSISCAPAAPPPGVTCCSPVSGSPCAAAPDPVAVINIFDGTTGIDPLFVGEYLAPSFTGGPRYRDWRLLPGSPLVDLGLRPAAPAGSPTVPAFSTDWDYFEPACAELRSFDWDHEQYGNPRDSGASIDIGFDEFQMFIMAGSYGNDSNSHNVPGFMSSAGTETGRPTRVMLFPSLSATANRVTVHGAHQQLTQPSPSVPPPPGWIIPPNTTYVVNPVLPVGFDVRYISFRNLPSTGTPTPWPPMQPAPPQGVIPTAVSGYFAPWCPGQAFINFSIFFQADAEIGHGYFGTQAVIHAGDPVGDPKLWSNLQYEYR